MFSQTYETRIKNSARNFSETLTAQERNHVRNALHRDTARSSHFRSGFGVATRRSTNDLQRSNGTPRRSLVETVAERHLDGTTQKTVYVRNLLLASL